MARQYLLSGKSRESVSPYLGSNKFDESLANDLFRRTDAGDIKHHATFAADKLYACNTREKAQQLTASRAVAEMCFTTVDIPFFLYIAMEEKLSKAAAIVRVAQQLNIREQNRRTQRALFWSCMYP